MALLKLLVAGVAVVSVLVLAVGIVFVGNRYASQKENTTPWAQPAPPRYRSPVPSPDPGRSRRRRRTENLGYRIHHDTGCFIIASFGDKRPASAPKCVSQHRSGGFLPGVGNDLDVVQSLVQRANGYQLQGVAVDVPGLMDHTKGFYLNEKLAPFLTSCQGSGELQSIRHTYKQILGFSVNPYSLTQH